MLSLCIDFYDLERIYLYLIFQYLSSIFIYLFTVNYGQSTV